MRQLVAMAAGATQEEITSAPFFVAHVMPERGPFWFEQPCAGLVGVTRETTRTELARAVVEGVIFADRMVLEATIPSGDESIYLTGAFGQDPILPQLLADATGREFDVVLEADLPAIGAAAMCAEAIHGKPPCLLPAGRISPRPQSQEVIERRWQQYQERWCMLTGGDLLPTLS